MAKRRSKQSRKTSAPAAADDPSSSEDAPAAKEKVAAATKDAATAPADDAGPSIKKRVFGTLLLLLALAAATFAAHGLCLKNPFYLDDQAHILKSARIHSGDWWRNGHRSIPYSIWIWLHTTYGFKSAAFHALNLILHGLTVFATYFAAREFARIEPVEKLLKGTPIARSFPFFAALLFAVHALCSEVINYASQTSIALVTLFLMISAGAVFRWIHTRNWAWLILAVAATALAAFSKQPGIWHALTNLGLIAVVFWKALPLRTATGIAKKWLPAAILLVALVAGAYFIRRFGLWHYVTRPFSDSEMGWHLLTQARVFWEYIWRMFLPVRLCSDHWIPITQSVGDVVAWIASAGILALIAGTVVLFWRQRVYCLLIALTLMPLLLRFAFRNQEPFVEYRTYPAMPWFCLLAVLFAGAFLLKRIRPLYFAIGATVVAIIFAGISAKRSATWNSARTLVIDIRKQYPLHVRSQSYIQAIDFSSRKYHSIIDRQILVRRLMSDIFKHNRENKHRKYIIARSLNSFMFCEQYNAYALIELKRPKEAITRVTEVIEVLSKAVNTDEGKAFAVLYRVRGKAHAALREFDKAAPDYRRALERMPDDLETPRLIQGLPPQFRAAAVPQPE